MASSTTWKAAKTGHQLQNSVIFFSQISRFDCDSPLAETFIQKCIGTNHLKQTPLRFALSFLEALEDDIKCGDEYDGEAGGGEHSAGDGEAETLSCGGSRTRGPTPSRYFENFAEPAPDDTGDPADE